MTALGENGFQIGEIYSLRFNNTTELIPRKAISYVSAKYQSKPGLLVIAGLFIVFGLYAASNQSLSSGPNGALGILGPIAVGILLVVAFIGSRRVGIVIASSGGRLFVETRGRHRLALLERIHSDLSAHQLEATRVADDPISAD
jgi:hypothetical protein